VAVGLRMTETKRLCYYIPRDSYIEGRGYRVAVVTEREPGYCMTGTWPYTGGVGETLPYFWGKRDEPDSNANYNTACDAAAFQNERMGHSEKDVAAIIASSMGKSKRAKSVKP
jgi:hypothetical protein